MPVDKASESSISLRICCLERGVGILAIGGSFSSV
jgi:hypothetical protein